MTEYRQLTKLLRPFPREAVKTKDTGKYMASYVGHDSYVDKLLAVVGPYDFQVVEFFFGERPMLDSNDDLIYNAAGDPVMVKQIEGCRARLTCEVDGRTTHVTEVGDVEHPSNWPTLGGQMKDAASDALKRCAMRLGVGLHLWLGAQPRSYLYYKSLDEYGQGEDTTGTDEHEVGDVDPEMGGDD